MKVTIREEYPGEFEDRKRDLNKALFPATRKTKGVKVPIRNFNEKMYQQLLKQMVDLFKVTQDDIFLELEDKLNSWFEEK